MRVRPLAPVEIFDPRTYVDGVPYALFADLRRSSPVAWIEEPAVLGWPAGPGYWAVFRHADVRTVLRDGDRFSSWLGATQLRDPATGRDLEFVRSMLLNMDRPEHTRLRRLMGASFTPRAVADLEAGIRATARSIMDHAAAGPDEFDFATVAGQLPTVTLANVLGVPACDREVLSDWANRVIGYQDDEYAGRSTVDRATVSDMARRALELWPDLTVRPGAEPLNPRSPDALADMFEYARLLAEQKRANPGSDVMSILRWLQEDGGVSEVEFQNMFFLLVVAGNETLRNGLPGGMLSLIEHPDQWELLRARPELLDSAVEEMLRFFPPGIHFRRTASQDVELGGQSIAEGEKVVVYFASANRDEAVFDDPDRFDITRSPNEHLSFGFGPHLCLGAHLARVQMRAVFSEVLRRFARVELAGEPVRMVSNFHNALKHLPVRTESAG